MKPIQNVSSSHVGLILRLISLSAIIISSLYMPLSFSSEYEKPIDQIKEIHAAEFDPHTFNLEEIIKNLEKYPFKTIMSNESIFWKENKIAAHWFEMPTIQQDKIIFQRLYFQSKHDSEFAQRLFTSENGKIIEFEPLFDRYASFEIDRKYSGKTFLSISNIPQFPLYGPSSIIIFSQKDYVQNSLYDRTYIGLVVGIVLIMSIYNIGMYLLFRKIYLVYYVFYSLSFLYLFSFTSGLISRSNVFQAFYYISGGSIGLNMMFFSKNVLSHLRENWFLKYFRYLCLAGNLALLIGCLLSNAWAITHQLMGGPIIFMLCFYMAVKAAYEGYRPAYPMMLGWMGILIAITLTALQFSIPSFPNMGWAMPIGISFEIATFSFAMGQKLRLSELNFMRENEHAFSEMKKMVYPHQIEKIRTGISLEQTMPTGTAEACVLSFDIVGSSKIKHIKVKEFFRNVFARCNEAMTEGYDGRHLKARAYRIKEMGDGFLCSIGYPFESMSGNPAFDAVELAEKFGTILAEESLMLHHDEPITCGIGIAIGTLTGFFPEAGTKEYDLFGQGLILATRYEGMRKVLFESEKGRSILIIQELVFRSLDPEHREGFELLNIKDMGIVVRDDPSAVKIYYKFLDRKHVVKAADSRHLKAI